MPGFSFIFVDGDFDVHEVSDSEQDLSDSYAPSLP